MKRMRVAVVTGTRAEFGIWRPVLDEIRRSPRLTPQLIVTGMHLQRAFGDTVRDVERSGHSIAARVQMYRIGRRPADSLAAGISGLAAAFRRCRADLVMVLGDRLEMLAAACAALTERIPIAHVHGGESAPGVWDEQIRHAITKMSHLHFCATKLARQRILRMGEDPHRVHQVGAPALDAAAAFVHDHRHLLPGRSLDLPSLAGPLPILVLHPSSADEKLEFRRTNMVLDALLQRFPRHQVFALGPNNDPGHRGILHAYRRRKSRVHLQMSLSQEKFWTALLTAGLLVGNSSSGIIEAATFGVPVINIGDRQAGRERNANVVDVPWNASAIDRAIAKATTNRSFLRRVARRNNIYGDGHAAERIRRILETVAATGIAVTKRFC